jgi:hypothetical protein
MTTSFGQATYLFHPLGLVFGIFAGFAGALERWWTAFAFAFGIFALLSAFAGFDGFRPCLRRPLTFAGLAFRILSLDSLAIFGPELAGCGFAGRSSS